ncbi:hypothetical protein ACI76O_03575 [Capnocytophaga cynodegmi]|uniref:hypothetical protein n=1 Tax=Capnocytophaga TaxID=1016 RepID=UPI0013DE14A4|nr:hypothetical protein [Capnocytophaga canimorsus]MDT9499114.1 hypothetical protein [Capnocytophaga canimorsus]
MKKEITESEWELIETIRNFKKVYPPSIELELYIYTLLDKLMDKEQDEQDTKKSKK